MSRATWHANWDARPVLTTAHSSSTEAAAMTERIASLSCERCGEVMATRPALAESPRQQGRSHAPADKTLSRTGTDLAGCASTRHKLWRAVPVSTWVAPFYRCRPRGCRCSGTIARQRRREGPRLPWREGHHDTCSGKRGGWCKTVSNRGFLDGSIDRSFERVLCRRG